MTDKQKNDPPMYIKNRRNSSKFKAFGSYYTLSGPIGTSKSPYFRLLLARYVPFLNDNANRYRQTNEFT